MLRIMVRSLAVAVCISLIASSAWAGGAYLYELGTPGLGTAALAVLHLRKMLRPLLATPPG